jgi:hypothetical protein
MADGGGRQGSQGAAEYDGDQMLLAFVGAAGFVLAAVFWMLLAVRLWGSPTAVACAVLSPACLVPLAFAWRLRATMEDGRPLTRWDVRRLLIAGLLLGAVLGALPYFVLHFKLEDPDFVHVASEPTNLPPAWR